MGPLEALARALELVLAAAAVTAWLVAPCVGGRWGRGQRALLAGFALIGFAHLAGAALWAVFRIEREISDVVHRCLTLIGLVFVCVGFAIMGRAFDE